MDIHFHASGICGHGGSVQAPFPTVRKGGHEGSTDLLVQTFRVGWVLVVVDGGARSIHLRVVAYRWLVLTSLLMAVSLTCGCIPWCLAL